MMLKKDWRSPKIDVRPSQIGGDGMFANADIGKGEELVVWGGNYTDEAGANEARKQGLLVMQWDDDLYSCEERGADAGYVINHSCDPSVWMADAYTLVAKRDIKKGEELTVDYAIFMADESYVSSWSCQCGAPLCRGHVTGNDWQNKELQERYRGHFSPILNKRIEQLK